MASVPKQIDVWYVAANTVYKLVPYTVVAGWVQEGRLGPNDMLRPGGTNEPWKQLGQWELFADYLPRPSTAVAVSADSGEPTAMPEAIDDEVRPRKRKPEEDDEVDMIPLIDISMVLLVFFIIMRAAGALAPVDVPDMKYAGELSNDADALTINIEKGDGETVMYSVRVGPNPAKAEHSNLPNPEAALSALDSILSSVSRPPEVRLACSKDLPSERVFELSRELKKRQTRGLINSSVATVTEAPKDK